MGSIAIQSEQVLKRDADGFLRHNVFDLFSLEGRTVVITGGARGIGLALAFAVAEAGGNVAIIDASNNPHEHYQVLKKRHNVKVEHYQYVTFPHSVAVTADTLLRSDVTKYDELKQTFDQIVADFGRIDGL